jgi:hypothetical protein
MTRKYLQLFYLIFMISGCATNVSGPSFNEAPPPQGDNGTLYVISSTAYFSCPVPIVKINDTPFVRLGFKGYSYIYLKPDVYRLAFVSGGTTIFMSEIEIKPGQDIYEYWDPKNFSMVELNPLKAPDFLKEYKYIAPIINKL